MNKFDKVTELPSLQVAELLAEEYAQWGEAARDMDKFGTAQLYEMISLLLRYYVEKESD